MDANSLQLDWAKAEKGLIPAVVQDASSGRVLMLGYMNREAVEVTLGTGWVTFWSRSRGRLWTKGESSGNRLELVRIDSDCDRDALLVTARPSGPTCHRGTAACFDGDLSEPRVAGFLGRLEAVIRTRALEGRPDTSYTARLLASGVLEPARKVGEEAIEVLVSAHESKARSIEESADLLYHLLVFLRARGIELTEVLGELELRHCADS